MTASRVVALALSMAVIALVAWLALRTPGTAPRSAAGSAAAPPEAAPTAPRADLVAALHTHEQLLAEADRLKLDFARRRPAPEAAAARPPRPELPDARKVALFYTGNVIGEHDPCG